MGSPSGSADDARSAGRNNLFAVTLSRLFFYDFVTHFDMELPATKMRTKSQRRNFLNGERTPIIRELGRRPRGNVHRRRTLGRSIYPPIFEIAALCSFGHAYRDLINASLFISNDARRPNQRLTT
jgi:hypothetical protein